MGFILAKQNRYTEAITAYKEAIKIEPKNSDSYYRLGSVLAEKGEHEESVLEYEKAIQLDPNNAGAHHSLGLEYKELGFLDKAVDSLLKALQIYEFERNILQQAHVLNALGNTYGSLVRDQQLFDEQKRIFYCKLAVDARERSIKLYNHVGSLPILVEAMLLMDLGTLYNDIDMYQSSIEVSNKVLSLLKMKERPNQINDSSLQDFEQSINESGATNFLIAGAFVNLGEAHRRLGDDQQALYAYDVALRVFQPLEIRSKQMSENFSQLSPFFKGLLFSIMRLSYSNLGLSQRAIDLDKRLQRFIESLGNTESEKFTRSFIPLFNSSRTIPDEKPIEAVNRLKFLFGTSAEGEVTWHQARGFAYFESKNYNQSLMEYDNALRLVREEANPLLRISLLSDKARVFLSMNQPQKALDMYTQALKLSQQADNSRVTGDILTQIGEAKSKLGEYDQAINVYNEALNLWLRLDIAEGQADIYFKTAQTERTRGNSKQALYRVEQAIKTIELNPQTGSSVTLITEESGVTPVSNDSQPVTLSGASNKSNENRVNYFQLKQKYYDFYVDLLMELDRQDPEGSYSIQALQANERSRTCSLEKFLEDGTSKNQQNGDKRTIQSGSNLCLGLKQPLQLADIQPLLDDETVVLEYALGEEHSYLWVITNKEIASYELPKRQQIEEAATVFYRYLTEPGLRVRPNKAKEAGEKLSQIVLGPISKQLKNQRLLIVADGALQYIPFSVLPDPRSDSIAKGTGLAAMQPLLVKHEILNLPASSILPTLRRSQHKRNQVPRELAIFSDPVFNLEDERLQKALTQPSQGRDRSSLALVKEALESPQNQTDLPEPPVAIYPRLPGTQDESNRIIEQILKRDPAAKISQFVGFNASYQAATNPELGQYRIVHFATHGLLNSNNPTRSGVVLSSTDEMGGLQRGLLSASDTFKLQLNADLVVVSSCRSGLSADVESGEAIAEGLFGLTGGFINGGAQRVVVSLWSVNDQATAEFMNRFYQYMLDSKSNLTPSQALRKAQLSMLREQRWQNPYYWAAFTMNGDWR